MPRPTCSGSTRPCQLGVEVAIVAGTQLPLMLTTTGRIHVILLPIEAIKAQKCDGDVPKPVSSCACSAVLLARPYFRKEARAGFWWLDLAAKAVPAPGITVLRLRGVCLRRKRGETIDLPI